MRAEDLLPGNADYATVGEATVRKGTVGAFIGNVRIWSDETQSVDARDAAAAAIRAAAPTLRATGLLDILAPREPALAALLADG